MRASARYKPDGLGGYYDAFKYDMAIGIDWGSVTLATLFTPGSYSSWLMDIASLSLSLSLSVA